MRPLDRLRKSYDEDSQVVLQDTGGRDVASDDGAERACRHRAHLVGGSAFSAAQKVQAMEPPS